jgi:hypothetical protein
MDSRQKWAKRVGEIFNTMPRDGNNAVWLPRKEMEDKFSDLIENRGVHICLDGPTGTGKSSLAFTVLNKLKIKYKLIQIAKSTDWLEFCKMLVLPNSNEESSVSAKIEVGLDKLLPQGKFEFSYGAKGRPADDLALTEAIISKWSEHDVCKMMAKENLLLFIDDFERANDNLVSNISDMCKLLTQSYKNTYAKIIIVGTGTICKRLFEANPSLESRLEQISLGTLPTPNHSWKFLLMGFEALGLAHPANDKLSKLDELYECIQYAYEAANGLPKSLNELGRKISLEGFGRKRVSPSDIKNVASQIPLENLKRYKSEFPKIYKCVENNPAVRSVLQHLYEEGIGHIHNWTDVEAFLLETFPVEQIEQAICELVEVNFLVKTGLSGDVLFVSNPSLAHTLGVIVSYPDKYKIPAIHRRGQLVLPFLKKDIEQSLIPANKAN